MHQRKKINVLILFNQHIDDLRFVTLKPWVLEDVGLRLSSMVVPVENKHKTIDKFTCHTTSIPLYYKEQSHAHVIELKIIELLITNRN